MKLIVLPAALAAVLAFSGTALAEGGCNSMKQQSVEKPVDRPVENPST